MIAMKRFINIAVAWLVGFCCPVVMMIKVRMTIRILMS